MDLNRKKEISHRIMNKLRPLEKDFVVDVFKLIDVVENDFDIAYTFTSSTGYCFDVAFQSNLWYPKPRPYSIEHVYLIRPNGERVRFRKTRKSDFSEAKKSDIEQLFALLVEIDKAIDDTNKMSKKAKEDKWLQSQFDEATLREFDHYLDIYDLTSIEKALHILASRKG